ncbi:type II secretion system protein GspC [Paraglaciecola sp. 2405UD69-4]|uniref:type II secretion system protein GspC n=1 Tax=Paraglaciecola sp. 2405UD69-4 TaxID=3391836 RepID=UPI0039C921E9
MTVANFNANQIWLQLVKNQHKINFVVVVLLSIFLLAYAAELTWRLWPYPEQTASQSVSTPKKTTGASARQTLNLAAIKRLNLFGDLTAKPVVVKEKVTDAPVTRLKLTLTGVVTSTEEGLGAAIIENRNQQQTYGVNDEIEGTNATLEEVHVDRVIISNNGVNETLMLDGVDYNKKSSSQVSKPSRQTSPREDSNRRRTLSSDALDARRELQQKPASFTDYIAVAPNRENGELTGYRVSPGKNSSLFKEVGLKSGDVVTDINGLDLTDIQQGLEAMNLLREVESLQMTVQREDELITIYLDLPEREEEQ